MMALDSSPGNHVNQDQWDGYSAEREEILTHFHASGVKNLVVLSGDLHTFVAGNLTTTGDHTGIPVGVELLGGSATSFGLPEETGLKPAALDALRKSADPHIVYADFERKGYLRGHRDQERGDRRVQDHGHDPRHRRSHPPRHLQRPVRKPHPAPGLTSPVRVAAMPAPATEVIVVGLGAMGTATCLALARQGVRVTGIDRFEPPHAYGSSHGGTRITRLAIGEGAEYIPLVRRSHELWRELEAESGTSLLTQCGGLILARPASAFFEQTRALAAAHGIEHERLSNAGAAPPLSHVRGRRGDRGLLRAVRRPAVARGGGGGATGARRPSRRDPAHGRAGRCGGRPVAEGVAVDTDAGATRADRLVLSVGAWLPELFPEGRELFAVYRQLMHWFAIREGYEQLRDMPVFVWDFGGERPEFVHLCGFYGFPAVDGPGGGLKIGTELYETTVTPDGRQHPATGRGDRAAVRRLRPRPAAVAGPGAGAHAPRACTRARAATTS